MSESTAAVVMNGGEPRAGPRVVGCKQSHQRTLNSTNGTIPSFKRPQISIEHVDPPNEVLPNSPPTLSPLSNSANAYSSPTSASSLHQGSKVYVPINDGLPAPSSHGLLNSPRMPEKTVKSRSLPSGVLLQDGLGNSTSSCDTPDSDSSDSQLSGVANADTPLTKRYHNYQVKVKDGGGEVRRGIGGGRRGRLASMDSELESSSDEVSSDEIQLPGTPNIKGKKFFQSTSMDPAHEDQDDDDVFQDGGLDACSHADRKLVDWAFNVFVPACRTMLFHCAEDTVDAQQIQLDLRNLSNLIGFFFNEHQRISTLMHPHRRLKQSHSASNFSKLEKMDERVAEPSASPNNTSRTSMSSNSSAGFDGADSLAERSYAVKVLRSISASLIAPLLKEAMQGFTPALYKSMVVAIQKISWKVEACLSFTNCAPDGMKVDIHAKIFDSEHAMKVSDMMIKTLPPEEPKLQMVAPGGRLGSFSASAAPRPLSLEHPLETSSSPSPATEKKLGKRPRGIVFDGQESPSAGLEEQPQSQVRWCSVCVQAHRLLVGTSLPSYSCSREYQTVMYVTVMVVV